MSPIFVRPVREQLEHDRLIRFLQLKYKRKFDVAVNIGDDQQAAVRIGQHTAFPDLLLTTGRAPAGLVEVESAESVNNLEAMAQWVPLARAKLPFHLYVPVTAYEAARRLCEAHRAAVTELWTYRVTFDGYDLVRMHHDPKAAKSGAVARIAVTRPPVASVVVEPEKAAPAPPRTSLRGSPKPAASPAAEHKPTKPVKAAGPAKPPRPVAPAKPVKRAKPARAAKPTKVSPAAKPARGAAGRTGRPGIGKSKK